jgi:hypothetical protein
MGEIGNIYRTLIRNSEYKIQLVKSGSGEEYNIKTNLNAIENFLSAYIETA